MRKSLFVMTVLAVGVASLLTGCSPYTLTTSEVYNDADLAQYRTFHIVTPDEGTLPPGMTMVTYYNIAAAVREQMVERGFTEDANSDLLVNLGLWKRRCCLTPCDGEDCPLWAKYV